MTKHEADVIGGLNMTDQISNEAYKQIMIAAQEENEVGDVLDNLTADLEALREPTEPHLVDYRYHKNDMLDMVLGVIERYK